MKGCGASTICSPRGTARIKGGSACSPLPHSPRPRRPNCCRRCAPSPTSTISDTPSICRRAAPKSISWCGITACVRRRFSTKHGFLGPRLFAAHCRYVDDADIALLGRSRTIISHQAAMAANRGVIPPIAELRAAGCPIANGTDNNTNDLFEVMRVALLTERISRNDPIPGTRPQPEDMLEDATQGGARAVQQEQLLGSLEVGKKADLIVLDTRRPTSCLRDASCRRGFTTVSRPTSSRAWWTASSSCATARCSRWTRTPSSPKPTRSDGASGERCSSAVRFRCRADHTRTDRAIRRPRAPAQCLIPWTRSVAPAVPLDRLLRSRGRSECGNYTLMSSERLRFFSGMPLSKRSDGCSR